MNEVHAYTINKFVNYKISSFSYGVNSKKYSIITERQEYGEEEVIDEVIIPIVREEFKDITIITESDKSIFCLKFLVNFEALSDNPKSLKSAKIKILDTLFTDYSKVLIRSILNKVKNNKLYKVSFFIAPLQYISYDYLKEEKEFNLPLTDTNNYTTPKELKKKKKYGSKYRYAK